mmetsp:Transcript_14328/g.39393  ORF Transcript_14328/g.39393 Transcript_14328/m.39393 type:complete len:221 (+) Transcript_14328:221-883(+)
MERPSVGRSPPPFSFAASLATSACTAAGWGTSSFGASSSAGWPSVGWSALSQVFCGVSNLDPCSEIWPSLRSSPEEIFWTDSASTSAAPGAASPLVGSTWPSPWSTPGMFSVSGFTTSRVSTLGLVSSTLSALLGAPSAIFSPPSCCCSMTMPLSSSPCFTSFAGVLTACCSCSLGAGPSSRSISFVSVASFPLTSVCTAALSSVPLLLEAMGGLISSVI